MWFSVEPSIFVMRPPRTVTSSVHASGQSSGQAVVTVDSGGRDTRLGHAPEHALRIEEMARLPQVIIIGGGFAGLDCRAAAPQRRLRRDDRRSSQPSRLPAAAVSGGDGRAVAGRHRVADPVDPAQAAALRVLLANVERIDSAKRSSSTLRLRSDGGETLVVRLPDRRRGRDALVLRPRRVGRGGARV